MKNKKIIPTDHELVLQPGERIFSTTDLSGRILSVNDTLVSYSGYTEKELIGKQHNILRHPSTPRAVFSLVWETIEKGGYFVGVIKNLCKDGSFYWTHAYVAPVEDSCDEVAGYESIRTFAPVEAIAIVEPLYIAMLAAEQEAGVRKAVQAGRDVLDSYLRAQNMTYQQWSTKLKRV